MVKSYEMVNEVDEELHQSSEMLSTIFALNPDAIALTKVSDGEFIDCNQEFLNQIGYSREEVIGHTSLELNLHSFKKRQRYIDEIRRTKTLSNFELKLRRKDGDFIDILNSARIITIDGEPIILNIGRDITERKKAENALVESEAKYHSLYSSMSEGVAINEIIYNTDQKAVNYIITGVNKAYEDITGFKKKDVLGKKASEIYSIERSPYLEIYAHVAETGEPKRFQTYVPPIDKYLNISVTSHEKGKFYTVFQDITEQKKAEEALRESEERFRDLADNIPNFAWMADANGGIFWFNKQWYEYTGTTLEEVQGWGWQKVHHPDNIKAVKEKWSAKIKEGKPYSNISYLRSKDGNYRWFITRVTPIRDEQGNLLRWFGTNTDITERKLAEEALLESENKVRSNLENLEKVLDAVPAGVWIAHDSDAIHVTGNKLSYNWLNLPFGAEASKSAPEEERPDTFRMFKDGKEMIPEEMPVQRSARGEEITNYEFSFVYPDGSKRHMLGNATPLLDEHGTPRGSVSSFMDITDRKISEEKFKRTLEELKHSNKELEQFAYVTSHDLREPLRMITSFLQLLQRRYNDQLDQDANEFIGFAVDGAKRLDAMTNDLLQYSKITSQKREIIPVNFEHVLEEALINLKVPIEENNAVITNDPLPTIKGDEQLKVQLFQNLIGNAIKYRSHETPKIHISAIKEKNQYLFSIKDNGIGMSPEHLERIFTIFQRLHTHEEYEGTGIGLAIAQKIVQQQGGQIWAESEPEKGTTFYFTIPNETKEYTDYF